jgi:short-subunit dehydrogenase
VENLEYVLITGASGGIGECFARALAARKRHLILVARTEAKLQALAQDLGNRHGVEVIALPFDLSAPNAAAQVVAELDRRGLSVDLLVNNAGFGAQGRFWQIPLEKQLEMLRLNVQALVEMCHMLLPRMAERKHGAVINVSSTAGFQPVGFMTHYAATKAFVTSFSLGLAEELRGAGVPVVTLCPGTTRTNFFVAGQFKTRKITGGVQEPEAVVKAALRKLDQGGGLVVPRAIDQAMLLLERLLPRRFVAGLAADVFRV